MLLEFCWRHSVSMVPESRGSNCGVDSGSEAHGPTFDSLKQIASKVCQSLTTRLSCRRRPPLKEREILQQARFTILSCNCLCLNGVVLLSVLLVDFYIGFAKRFALTLAQLQSFSNFCQGHFCTNHLVCFCCGLCALN